MNEYTFVSGWGNEGSRRVERSDRGVRPHGGKD